MWTLLSTTVMETHCRAKHMSTGCLALELYCYDMEYLQCLDEVSIQHLEVLKHCCLSHLMPLNSSYASSLIAVIHSPRCSHLPSVRSTEFSLYSISVVEEGTPRREKDTMESSLPGFPPERH